ncbi:MAG: hypothetical protein QM606_10385 [Leucobacter sp.]
MRVRTPSAALAEALARLGSADGEIAGGLVFAPRSGIASWEEAEEELADAFGLSRQAMIAEAPVVYVLHADAVLGRAPVLDSAVADALVGGARALAFEGRRRGRYATVIGVDAAEDEAALAQLARSVEFTMSTRSAAGQILMLADQHLGAMLP